MLPHVLLVTNEFPPEKIAGTAVATRFLAEELTSRGARVTVVVNTQRTAPRREADGGLAIIRLRPAAVPLTRMAQRAASLVAVARRVRPDILQGQSLSCGALAVAAGRLLGIPAVTYVQGLDLYHSGRWARRTYIRWALRYSDRVVTVTPDLRDRAHAVSGRLGEVIPHGLKLRAEHGIDRRTARAALGLPAGDPIVLFAGRLIALKGVPHLLRAMTAVAARFPEARLVVVGDGEDRAALTGLARDLGLERCVTFAGARPHDDVIRFMRAADVFVLPSLIESFGIVLLEAMSCGLPIVASDVMGIPSIVDPGRNGTLVAPGDEAGLAAGITRFLSDPDLRAAVGRENVERAGGYAYPRIADRFLALWDGAVRARAGYGVFSTSTPNNGSR